jgi:hypothetical protein
MISDDDLVKRLRSDDRLPYCPYDRRSPDYWTAPNDKPCKVCGTLNDMNAPDLCNGTGSRIMAEAADRIEALEREVKRCHARLEIDHAWTIKDGKKVRCDIPEHERAAFPDGIECRNETIKLLDQNIATLRANAKKDESRLSEALAALKEIEGIVANAPKGSGGATSLMLRENLARIATLARTQSNAEGDGNE